MRGLGLFATLSGFVFLFHGIGGPHDPGGNLEVSTLAGGKQTIARGPVAAILSIKQLGTNGGGFFGTNSAHPLENPNAFTNVIECAAILLVPMSCVVLFGAMLKAGRQALVVYLVMLALLGGFIALNVALDSRTANPGLAGLPIDGSWGNLEGKELRFGTSAGPTWAAITTCTSNGSVNCMHDSLNPLAGLVCLVGMWLNCIFGGVGVGLINFLVYLIVGVFLAGLMVGRTPEYLGKKVEAKEMKLAMLALLIHPLMILAPNGLSRLCPGVMKRPTIPEPMASPKSFTSSPPPPQTTVPDSRDWRIPTDSLRKRPMPRPLRNGPCHGISRRDL